MFLNKRILTSTAEYSAEIERLKEKLLSAEAVVIGAGAGLSTAAGFTYSGERFDKYFPDFSEKYGFSDMYSGGFYPFETPEEYWAFWSRNIYCNRYEEAYNSLYKRLYSLVKDKNYFVLTTNVDHQFQKAGFDKSRLFYTQGDYGLFQCSVPCHRKTYDNEEVIRRMLEEQKNMCIPSELVPVCPECGKPMTVNLRCDNTFVQDEGWYRASERYSDFIRRYSDSDVLFLELGVGFNTPAIIKYPFWQMTAKNTNAIYACINYGEAICPDEIGSRAICLNMDISKAVELLLL